MLRDMWTRYVGISTQHAAVVQLGNSVLDGSVEVRCSRLLHGNRDVPPSCTDKAHMHMAALFQ